MCNLIREKRALSQQQEWERGIENNEGQMRSISYTWMSDSTGELANTSIWSFSGD